MISKLRWCVSHRPSSYQLQWLIVRMTVSPSGEVFLGIRLLFLSGILRFHQNCEPDDSLFAYRRLLYQGSHLRCYRFRCFSRRPLHGPHYPLGNALLYRLKSITGTPVWRANALRCVLSDHPPRYTTLPHSRSHLPR